MPFQEGPEASSAKDHSPPGIPLSFQYAAEINSRLVKIAQV